MVFTVSQIYLSDAISGRDKALQDLRNQIDALSNILIIESKDKQQALKDPRQKAEINIYSQHWNLSEDSLNLFLHFELPLNQFV